MVVNNGKIYKPHVLREVRDPGTKAIEKVIAPEVLHKSDVNPSVFENVRNDMRSVVTMGTAQLLGSRVIPVQIAGKTGTAQIGLDDRWHLWFTSFAPYNSSNPEDVIAVTVIFESSTYQNASPAIAAAIIYQGYFAKQNYEEAIRSLGFRHGI
jgi:penicillin-binding protein 2